MKTTYSLVRNYSKQFNFKKHFNFIKMKKIINLFPVALAVLGIASCSELDEQSLSQEQSQLGETKIVATIDQGEVTRVGMGRNDEGQRGLVFTNGDLLNVYTLSSTKFCAYQATGIADGESNDQVEFAFDAANSSAGATEFNLTDGEDYYAVTRTGSDQKIYSLSAGAAGPELSMSIPRKYTKEDVTAQWSNNTKSGKGYTFPLPLWGKIVAGGDKAIGSSQNAMVNLRYLTGFLGINLTTMRAGTKYIKITADKPVSGYFQTVLDPNASDDPSVTNVNLLQPHEALNTFNDITVELPEANDYEGATDMFYIPLIAQTYSTLTIEAYDQSNNLIQTLYELPAAATYTAKRGKGVTLECGMTVLSNLTNGADISSKIYELCQRNKKFTIGLYESLVADQTIYIDKNATSEINIQMLKLGSNPAPAVTGNITIVEATVKSVDPNNGNVTWETDVTNENSLSGTKKHTVNFIYNNEATNTGNVFFYLPAAAASIAQDGEGSVPYKGQVKSLTATDGGFTILGNLTPNNVAKAYTNLKNGPIYINGIETENGVETQVGDGYTQYLIQYGASDVTIYNLKKAMERIQMGSTTSAVAGKLTINGAAQTGNGNGATVNVIQSYSTGDFLAKNLDGKPSTGWTFNETANEVKIQNNDKYITNVPKVTFNKKNVLVIDNAWIDEFEYKATLKSTVSATGKSAIKQLTSDDNDLLSISSTWNGKKLNTTTDKVNGADATVLGMLNSEIHTAFQLANIPGDTEKNYTLKSTTVLDMNCTAADNKWTPITASKAISINGDKNNQEASAQIKNLYNKLESSKYGIATYGGFFGNCTAAITLENLVFNGVDFEDYVTVGGLVAQASAKVTLNDIKVEGTNKAIAKAYNNGSNHSDAIAGGLLGNVQEVDIDDVDLTVASVKADNAIDTKVEYAGGLIGCVKTTVGAINGVKVAATNVQAGNAAAGLIADAEIGVTIAPSANITKNVISATSVKTDKAGAENATAGLIAVLKDASTITATSVSAGLTGLLNLGGMVGMFNADTKTLKFGDETKTTLTEVAATFALESALNTDANKTAFADNFGSANTYVGNVKAGIVTITKWCKHGTPISTAAAKNALNFKKNVVIINEGENKNYLYFWSGNPWVGTVASTANISFPNAENVAGLRTNETDYNVRRNTNFYNDDSWTADWE